MIPGACDSARGFEARLGWRGVLDADQRGGRAHRNSAAAPRAADQAAATSGGRESSAGPDAAAAPQPRGARHARLARLAAKPSSPAASSWRHEERPVVVVVVGRDLVVRGGPRASAPPREPPAPPPSRTQPQHWRPLVRVPFGARAAPLRGELCGAPPACWSAERCSCATAARARRFGRVAVDEDAQDETDCVREERGLSAAATPRACPSPDRRAGRAVPRARAVRRVAQPRDRRHAMLATRGREPGRERRHRRGQRAAAGRSPCTCAGAPEQLRAAAGVAGGSSASRWGAWMSSMR